MKIKNNIVYITSGILNFIGVVFLLFSYYLKKEIGSPLHRFILILYFFFLLILSGITVLLVERKRMMIFFQILICSISLIIYKFNIEDRFALIFEIPKIEKRIENIKRNNSHYERVIIDSNYFIFEWEPGFLDYQMVLVYDENDSLKKGEILVSEGKLSILYRAKKNFYMCVLYR